MAKINNMYGVTSHLLRNHCENRANQHGSVFTEKRYYARKMTFYKVYVHLVRENRVQWMDIYYTLTGFMHIPTRQVTANERLGKSGGLV